LIEGAASNPTTLDACHYLENKLDGVHVQDGGVVQIAGGSARRNGERGLSFVDAGPNCSVIGTQVADNVYYGIFLQSHAQVPAMFRANVCTGHAYSGIVGEGPALLTVKDNQCEANLEDGILLGKGVGGEVSGNVCFRNSRFGIALDGASQSLVVGENKLEGNGEAPFFRQ